MRKLLAFADVEATAGATSSAPPNSRPIPPRRYLEHAIDELRHAVVPAPRCPARTRSVRSSALFDSTPLRGAGLGDLAIVSPTIGCSPSFIAEKAAAGRFEIYHEVVDDDPATRAIFAEILRDEVFHANYTYMQLARIAPRLPPRVWLARASRLWKRYCVGDAVPG